MSKTRSPFLQSRTDGGVGPLILSDPRFFGVGNIFFVQSVHANANNAAGHGQTPDAPLASIDYAVGLCTASQGDLIIALPGHVETITAAGGLDLDCAGITVLGIGNGRLKPKLDFTSATTADCDIDAANITLEGFFIDCTSKDALAGAIDVNSADFTMRNCEFELADAAGQCVAGIVTDDNADRMRIENCYFHGAGDTTAVIAIDTVGGDDIVIRDCIFDGYFGTTGAIQNATTASTNFNIINNVIVNRTADGNNKVIVMHASTVSIITGNRGGIIDSTSPAPVTAAAGWVGGNWWSTAVGVAASTLM